MQTSPKAQIGAPGSELHVIEHPSGPMLTEFVGWWHKLSSAGLKPGKADFKLAEWKRHLPWIAAFDMIRDEAGLPADALVKVYGTRLVEPFGGDVTGQKISQFGEPYFSRWQMPAQLVEQRQAPVCVSGKILLPDRNFQPFELALLPLYNDSGVIERLLTEAELKPVAG
jgi:hypothetical protein